MRKTDLKLESLRRDKELLEQYLRQAEVTTSTAKRDKEEAEARLATMASRIASMADSHAKDLREMERRAGQEAEARVATMASRIASMADSHAQEKGALEARTAQLEAKVAELEEKVNTFEKPWHERAW